MSKPKTRIAPRSQPSQTTPTTLDPATLPERYVLIVEGTCLEPEAPNGSKVLIDRDGKIAPGDLAALYLKLEHIRPGKRRSVLKRVVMPPPSYVKFPWREHPQSEAHAVVIVEMTNPPQQFVIKCEHLLGIHKCLGRVPADVVNKPKSRKEESRA